MIYFDIFVYLILEEKLSNGINPSLESMDGYIQKMESI